VIFDEVKEAEGKEYFRLGAMAVSHDGRYAAILVDDDGSERFQLRIRDLATGKDIETVTEVGIGQPVWTADSRASSIPRSTRIGAATAPASTASASPPAPTRRCTRRRRMSPSPSASASRRTRSTS
jgi:prolyl oligopeptidase PreP (S9A serine peptidase family)